MDDPKDSLIIEFRGLKASASGRVTVMATLICLAVLAVFSVVYLSGQIVHWATAPEQISDK